MIEVEIKYAVLHGRKFETQYHIITIDESITTATEEEQRLHITNVLSEELLIPRNDMKLLSYKQI